MLCDSNSNVRDRDQLEGQLDAERRHHCDRADQNGHVFIGHDQRSIAIQVELTLISH